MQVTERKPLAIVGFGKENFDRVDWPSYDIWTLNDWYKFRRRLVPHRVYQIHTGEFTDIHRRMIDWKEKYDQSGAEVIVGKPHGLKNEKVFDWGTAVSIRGSEKWFSCTICYMLHDAQMEGYRHIRLVGIELENGSEYRWQYPGVQNAVNELRSSGIIIEWPDEERLAGAKDMVDWGEVHTINVMGYGR